MNSLAPRLDRFETNVIFNSGLPIWRRGTSQTMTSNDQFILADRFRNRSLNGSTVNTSVTQSSDLPPGSLANFSMKWDITTAEASPGAGFIYDVQYVVEGYDLLKMRTGQTTLFFKTKSAKTGPRYIVMRNSAQDRRLVLRYTVDVADTWEVKRILVPIIDATIGGWNITDQAGVRIHWVQGAGANVIGSPTLGAWENGNYLVPNDQINLADNTNNDMFMTEFMILSGDLTDIDDVPFRWAGRNIQDENAFLERYFEEVTLTRWRATIASGTAEFQHVYNTYKRAVPTIVNPTGSNISFITETQRSARVTISANAANGSFGADADFV